jgi:hypothetical protein
MKNFDKIILIKEDEILFEGKIQITSKKAIAVTQQNNNKFGQNTLLWIPKSLLKTIDNLKQEQINYEENTLQSHVCTLPDWFLSKKNLI